MKKEALLAEFLGTFFLVFFGCGAVIVNELFGGELGQLGICIVFGLVVMAVIYSFGNVSGAHINPAVTLALCFAGRFDLKLLPSYVAMQLIGLAATEMDKLKTEDADAHVKDIDRLDQFLEVAVMTQAAFQIEGMAS